MAGRSVKDEPRFTREHERAFIDFLGKEVNQKRIQDMVAEGRTRFAVNLDELRQVSGSLVQALISDPVPHIDMMVSCIKQFVGEIEGQEPNMKGKQTKERFALEVTYDLSFEGNFGRNHVTPRGLVANNVGQLMRVQGIVTKLSLVRPKLLSSVHYCEECKKFTDWNYTDPYDVSVKKKEHMMTAIPTKDMHDHSVTMEFGLCHYKDCQTITLQEMPERTPAGQLPRSIDVSLEKDLVDKAKPGDRIDVVGIYRAVPGKPSEINGIFRTILIAVNITHLNEIESLSITERDIKRIQEVAKRKDAFELLSSSIAPSIEGHKYIKKALLLQLLGGVEKVLESGTHLRGDINVLLVGDPSTGKSQLLRSIMNIASLAISTTGRGSTGVGLTAAVVMDKDSGERHLEAGAMVLGDRGLVCIDEFDKMSDIDRVAIHEVMEQQTVTIAKAGIYTSLNARCSVLAAANPVYGEYMTSMSMNKNIGLPDSLLSRFDLLFVTLDEKEAAKDRKIAQRVILNHRYKGDGDSAIHAGYWAGEDIQIEPDAQEEEGKETQVFEKNSGFLYGSKKNEIVTKTFLKKYIAYAKKRSQPRLDNESVNYVSECWSKMRPREQVEKALPITVRTLETIIRLATAHAKCRLSDEVTKRDCQVAEKLLNYAIFREVPEEDKEKPVEEPEPMSDGEGKPKKKTAKKQDRPRTRGGRKDRDKEKDTGAPEEEGDTMKEEAVESMKDVKSGTTGGKKRKVDPEEDVEELLKTSLEHIDQQQYSEKEKKFVYRIINKLHSQTDTTISVSAIWSHIKGMSKEEKKDISFTKEEDLIQILMLLDNNGKLTYSTKSKTVAIV